MSASIWSPTTPVLSPGVYEDLADTSDVTKGDALLGVKSTLIGSVARTQHSKNSETISVKDFGATGDGTTDDTGEIQAALDSGAGTVHFPAGSYLITAPLKINSYTKLYGDGMATTIIKSTNTTVTITDPTSGLSYTRNCAFYVNPAYVPNPDHPSTVDAAVQVEMARMRVRFTAVFDTDSSAVFTTQLGKGRFVDLYSAGCDWGIDAATIYTSHFERVVGRACRVTVGGTSNTWVSCGGGGTQGSSYVWNLGNVVYSTLIGCYGEDRTTAFKFDNCQLTMISCGSEVTTGGAQQGFFAQFGNGNDITVIDAVPFAHPTSASGPVVSISGVGSRIRFIGGNFYHYPGQAGVYDLWLQSYGSRITFEDTVFYDNTTTNLSVQCNGAMNRTGSPAYVKSGDTITRFTPNSVSSPLLESVSTLFDMNTANAIVSAKLGGGNTFDFVQDRYYADGAEYLRVGKRGSASTSFTGSVAGSAEVVVVGGAVDLVVGTDSTNTGKLILGQGGAQRIRLDSTDGITLVPSAVATPDSNGELCIQATSNTSLTFKFKGSDGTVRSGSIVLA